MYMGQHFQLDGRMDLDVQFDGKTMCTPVYIMLDAPEQLLLSEGVCRQLGIIDFHPEVKQSPELAKDPSAKHSSKGAMVPLVRVRLLQSVKVPPIMLQ